ncbi:hypothetical protein MMC31_002680 [Peltigera leucophlebia]|nr:hypothetical protein [Peltigera leucophlebia]
MDNPSLSPSPGPSASMANRGRYNSLGSSPSSGINSPRRMRKRRDPTPFNILIIGAKNCGKTSFLNLLRSSLVPPDNLGKSCSKNPGHTTPQYESSSSEPNNRRLLRFSSQYLETKIDNELFGITIWDSEGLIPSMVDLQLRDIVTFLESKFEETYDEEVKLARDPGARDTQVHCVFLLLDPVRIELNLANSRRGMGKEEDYHRKGAARVGGLDEEFNLQALRMLCEKTTVIPVVTKADTVTLAQMSYLKRAVWESIRANALDPFDIINRNSLDNNNTSSHSPQSWPSSASGGNSESRYCHNDNVDDHHDDDDHGDDGDHDDDERMANKAEKEKHSSSSNNNNNANGKTSNTTKSEAGGGTLSHRIYEPTTHTTTSTNAPTTYMMTSPTSILPLSIISPDTMYNQGFPGRDFPWGAARTDDPLHCDFSKLKELVFVEWRDEMRESSRVLWYERWRTARLDRWNHNNDDDDNTNNNTTTNNASKRMEVGNRKQQQQRPGQAGG